MDSSRRFEQKIEVGIYRVRYIQIFNLKEYCELDNIYIRRQTTFLVSMRYDWADIQTDRDSDIFVVCHNQLD